MASNQLSTGSREVLKQKLDLLFGRVIKALPCPLTYNERTLIGRMNLSEDDAQTVAYVERFGVLNHQEYMHIYVDSRVPGAPPLHMCMLPTDAVPPHDTFRGFANSPTDSNRFRIAERIGPVVATNFFKWLEDATQLTVDITDGRATFQAIMDMVSTEGHLRRMVPELYRLIRSSPNPQTRASAVPYEWSAFPRQRVDQLVSIMAKCQLLPESEVKWSDIGEHTWAVID